MVIIGDYPNFKQDICKNYKLTSIDRNSPRKQKKYSYRIMLLLYFPLCFVLGFCSFYYDSNIVFALNSYIVYFVLLLPFVCIVHEFLRCVSFPMECWKGDCFVGISTKYFIPFCYCKKALSRNRLLFTYILPMLFLTLLPIAIMCFTGIEMILLAIVSINILISSFDIYDIYILIAKSDVGEYMILKSNNRFYFVESKEREFIKERQFIKKRQYINQKNLG